MAASSAEMAVFADTNIGTHFAVGVPSNITATELKRELERAHCSCFPNLGDIAIEAFMVKKNINLYHLPDSAPIFHYFQESERPWVLSINVKRINSTETKRNFKRKGYIKKRKRIRKSTSKSKSKRRIIWFSRYPLLGFTLTALLLRRGKSKRRCIAKVKHEPKGVNQDQRKLNKTVTFLNDVNSDVEERNHHQEEFCPVEEGNPNSHPGTVESLSGRGSSEAAAPSVSGLINRYFSSIVEATDQPNGPSKSVVNGGRMPRFLGMPCNGDQKPPFLLKCTADMTRRNEGIKRFEVGKRLVRALAELEVTRSRQKSMITPLCRSSERRRLFSSPAGSNCPVKSLVFEISDDSD